MYEVTLDENQDASKAFQIIPSQGYQNMKFSIAVIDSSLLDYDKDDKWRQFDLKVCN